MKESINLWFIDSDKKRRVPQVFSKVLMNFMLGRYPTSVFERFSKYRLEYILGELLSKTTDKNFFSEMRPIWWPESIEFVPLSVLHQKIQKNAPSWILHLQELLLSAREFYSEQLYLPRKRCNKLKTIKESKGKSEKAKHKPKICIRISPAIFKPIRNENSHPNIMPNIVKNPFAKLNDSHLTDHESVMEPRNIHIDETTRAFQTSIVDQCLNRTPRATHGSCVFPSISWKPYVYLNDILRKEPLDVPIDLTHYASENCKVKLYDILKINQFDKASYMNMLGLYESPTTSRQKTDSPRTVTYKRYSPSVPFSSMGGQLIIGSFKGRYYRNTNCERNARRGCSINDPLHQKVHDAVPNVADTKNKNSRKMKSYHVYKFCRRRPFNSLDLPDKIREQYCRNTIVKVDQLSATVLKAYMRHCKVMLTPIRPSQAKYLQKYNVHM